MTDHILYQFSINSVDLVQYTIGVVFGLCTFLCFVMSLIDDDMKFLAIVGLFTLLISGFAFDKGINSSNNYAIMKLETFSEYEEVVDTGNQVKMIDKDVFLVKITQEDKNK